MTTDSFIPGDVIEAVGVVFRPTASQAWPTHQPLTKRLEGPSFGDPFGFVTPHDV
jgi:hypothetical protein